MLQKKATGTVVFATFCILALGGCVAEPADLSSPTAATLHPTFASEEDALVAADLAYTNYLVASDRAGQSGGEDDAMMATTTTPMWLQYETEAALKTDQLGRIQQGAMAHNRVTLQQLTNEPDGRVRVVIYACLDVSQIVIVDSATGENPTSPAAGTVPVEVTFESDAEEFGRLLVASHSPWEGENFCL